MIQGTTENAAWRIAKNGFGTVATMDKGYYGQGMYFTSQIAYASKYTQGENTFLVSLVVPGNTFPVTESPTLANKKDINPDGYLGAPCKSGYQSHYVAVNMGGNNHGYPVTEDFGRAGVDELVVFETAQALPLFLFVSDQVEFDTDSIRRSIDPYRPQDEEEEPLRGEWLPRR